MENINSELKHFPLCQCRSSIKLKIINIANSNNCPFIINQLIEEIFKILKSENENIVIDDNFLKTYIKSIISELIDEKIL